MVIVNAAHCTSFFSEVEMNCPADETAKLHWHQLNLCNLNTVYCFFDRYFETGWVKRKKGLDFYEMRHVTQNTFFIAR